MDNSGNCTLTWLIALALSSLPLSRISLRIFRSLSRSVGVPNGLSKTKSKNAATTTATVLSPKKNNKY